MKTTIIFVVIAISLALAAPIGAYEGLLPDGRTYVEVFGDGDAVITDTVTGKKRYVTGYAPSEYERRVKEQADRDRAKRPTAIIHPDGSASFVEY